MKSVFFCIAFAFACSLAAVPGSFVHISDTHLQIDYIPYSSPELDCSGGSGDAGIFGSFKCRAPYRAQRSAFDHFAKLAAPSKPEFILWTGDGVSRYPNQQYTWEGVLELITNITFELVRVGKEIGAKIYPVLGNHDCMPQHQFPASSFWVYETVADLWRTFLSESSLRTIRKAGYYAENVSSKLRLVVLNTALYYVGNKQVPRSDPDPAGQIAWMRGQLASAKAAEQVVYLAGHVPPPLSWDGMNMYPEFQQRFIKGLDGFHDVIAGSFWGHMHSDFFQLLGNASVPGAAHPAFWCGHLGGDTDNNPNWRIVEFDPETYKLLDWRTFYYDIDRANFESRITWEELYRATDFFRIKDLSTESMLAAHRRLASSPELFAKFFSNSFGAGPRHECDAACRKEVLCGQRYSFVEEYKACMAH